MPAVSKKQQVAMSIAEHEPGKLLKRNRGLLSLSHDQLHDFASTPRAGLPSSSGGSLSRAAERKRHG